MHVQLYKGGQSVWATGTDREQTKPTVLNVQVRDRSPLQHPHRLCLQAPFTSWAAASTPFHWP